MTRKFNVRPKYVTDVFNIYDECANFMVFLHKEETLEDTGGLFRMHWPYAQGFIVLCFLRLDRAHSSCDTNAHFQSISRLRITKNDTVPPGIIFCSPNLTKGHFPMHKGSVLHKPYVVGFYKRDWIWSQLCYFKKIEPDWTDVSTLSGGVLHTIGYLTCPSGFEQMNLYCYNVNRTEDTFDQHKQSCAEQGGYLAAITSSHENVSVSDYLGAQYFDNPWIWIGLEDTVGQNNLLDYKWVKDNSVMGFSNWNGYEPNNDTGNETCVMTNGASSRLGRWFDTVCDEKKPALCEAELQSPQLYYQI